MYKKMSIIVLSLILFVVFSLPQNAFANAEKYVDADFSKISSAGSVNGIVIANKQNPLPKNYGSENATAKSQLDKMLKGAKDSGYNIVMFSSYRSFDKQLTLYNNYVSKDGKEKADTYSARAGYSEHQTGLAFDLADSSVADSNKFSSSGNTTGMQWIRDNAHKYGFILRYTSDNKGWTGYDAEFWHFRYIGVNNAMAYKEGKYSSLEEFVGMKKGEALGNKAVTKADVKAKEPSVNEGDGGSGGVTVDWSQVPDEHKKNMVLSPAYYLAYMKAKELGVSWSSGYRTQSGNASVGGYSKSYHLKGQAGDFTNGSSQTKEMDALYNWAVESKMFVEIIYSPLDGKSNDHYDHVHLAWESVESGSDYVNGETSSGTTSNDGEGKTSKWDKFNPFKNRSEYKSNVGIVDGAKSIPGEVTYKFISTSHWFYKTSVVIAIGLLAFLIAYASIVVLVYVAVVRGVADASWFEKLMRTEGGVHETKTVKSMVNRLLVIIVLVAFILTGWFVQIMGLIYHYVGVFLDYLI